MNYLITGVSKGLGLNLAAELLKNGDVIYGVSRTMTKQLEELKQNNPEKLKWISYDLSNSGNVRATILKEWIGFETPLHGYVNNAAIAYDDLVTNLNLEALEKMYRVNVFTPMMLTKYVIRQMLLHNIKGSLVHLSSISVHTGYKGLAMYASTKGALEGFSKNTAREWGEKGIRSNCLVAGFMETDMNSLLTEVQKQRIYNRTSLKRPVNINSVVSTVIFLLKDSSSSITGENIFVTNGTI